MKYLLKRLSRREESFPSHSMAYSGLTVENGVFMENVLLLLTIVLIDTCVFRRHDLFSVRTNADRSCSILCIFRIIKFH